jgi:hypothetical protein
MGGSGSGKRRNSLKKRGMNMPAFWMQRWSVQSPYRLKFSEKIS